MAVQKGDKVKIEYEGKLEDGTVFDKSDKSGEQTPLEFVVGDGRVIPGFEEAVLGMNKDEEKECTIPKDKAYGDMNPEAIQEVPKNAFPKDQEPKVGMMIGLKAPTGQQMAAKITEIKADTIVLDMNHPLAGKDLTFKIKVVDIESKQTKAE